MGVSRLFLQVLLVSAVVGAMAGGSASPAQAFATNFCNGQFYQPGDRCNGYPDDWDRVRARYPGHQSHNVVACVWQTDGFGIGRGGTYCNPTWSDPTWNPMGHNWGDTWDDYYPFNGLPPGQPSGHTLVGWASNNQTDN